jgi:hypothetical protein
MTTMKAALGFNARRAFNGFIVIVLTLETVFLRTTLIFLFHVTIARRVSSSQIVESYYFSLSCNI